ncbi:32394_t:CDS:2, partial [Racocetra persica]
RSPISPKTNTGLNGFFVYNIDDYHNIHKIRRPDTVSLSAPIHFATCISKEISKCAPIPINYNSGLVHNPKNVDVPLICLNLITNYHGIFDLSYSQKKNQWVASQKTELLNFDKIDLLSVHCYDDAIKNLQKERSTKG